MTARAARRREDRLRALALACGDLARQHALLADGDARTLGRAEAYADVADVLSGLLGLDEGGVRVQSLSATSGASG